MTIAWRHIGCSSRGGPGSTTTVGPARPSAEGTTSPAPCRPARARSRPRGSSPACGCRARSRRGRGWGSAPRAACRISAIRPSSASSSTISRPWKRPTTSAVRSSAVGPRPPLVRTTSRPCSGHEAERAAHVRGTVADDRRVGQVDARLPQPVGQPRAVAVAYAAGQHLGAGHTMPARAARRSLHVGSWLAAACGGPRA